MFKIRIYESPDLCSCTEDLDTPLPVDGPASWKSADTRPDTVVRIVGLKYKILSCGENGVHFDSLLGSMYINAWVNYAGEVGSLAGWLMHCERIPCGSWAAYLCHLLRGTKDHVATGPTQVDALKDAIKTCKVLGIACG